MTQSCCQLINCLSLSIELSPILKALLLLSLLNCWNKTQNLLTGQSFKSLHATKIKNILNKKMHQQIPILGDYLAGQCFVLKDLVPRAFSNKLWLCNRKCMCNILVKFVLKSIRDMWSATRGGIRGLSILVGGISNRVRFKLFG